MIYDYTEEESEKLQVFQDEQNAWTVKLQNELWSLDRDTPEYNSKLEELTASMDKLIEGYISLTDEFEKAHFDALGGDPETILQNGIDQAPKILEFYYSKNWKTSPEHPGKPYNAKLEIGEATEIINRELHLHFDALSNDPARYKALKDNIYKCISISPYVYTDTHKSQNKTDISQLIDKATKPPKLTKYGIEKDKVNKISLQIAPSVREIDGQLYMLWNVNQASPNHEMVPVLFGLSSSTAPNVQTSRRIEAKDDAILTTVSNMIYKSKSDGNTGPYNFTPQEIWRQMNGITDGKTAPSTKQLNDINARIDKMRHTDLYMDIRNELNANFISITDDRIRKGIIEDYYLPARKCIIETEKGKRADGYSFYDLPFLYVYNIAKGHIVIIDAALLDTSDTVTENDDLTIIFRYYLLREIAEMYTKDRDSTRILYSTLYSNMGINPPATRFDREKYKTDNAYNTAIKKAAKADRDKINNLLQSWTNKNWILGFSPVKAGRTYKGIDIQLNPKNYQTTKPQK